MNTIVRFIMKTARLSNVFVTDLKFTDLFLFYSREESSPHNTSPLKAERLYLRIPCIGRCIHTNTELKKLIVYRRLYMHNVYEVKVQRWTYSCVFSRSLAGA